MEIQQIKQSIRSSAILTGSYIAGTILTPKGAPNGNPTLYNQLVLLVNFTKGSLTTAEIKVEFSQDGITYYQELSELASGGTVSETLVERALSATGKYRIPIDIADRYIKVSVKGTGTPTGSSMSVDAILAVK